MKLTLGFSPCPNDTFIFDALVNRKIETDGLELDVLLEDVQTLNAWAKQGKLDISKISYGVLPKVVNNYVVLRSGGALGKGVGPLLISSRVTAASDRNNGWQQVQEFVSASVIAIPGEDTTAHFLFSQAFPLATNKVFMRFDEIENWVLSGNGLGVIIHENRFTYHQKGLDKIADLGDLWEQSTGNPIPLGGIIMKRSFDGELIHRVDSLIRQSLEYAFAQYPEVSEYVRCHAQEMSEDVMRQHIDLYVNDFSLDVGETGQKAVLELLQTLGSQTYTATEVFSL
jgi:1,4-dihydroxy-6-naphthoate synthase